MSPSDLQTVLKELPPIVDPNVLVGINTGDDAAVYQISDDLAIIQTVDFLTPVVDDPFQFGAIAAANALSDVYAMGARPLFALNVIGFHTKELPLQTLTQILKGGAAKALEAGIEIIGGHSIDDQEPKYGLSVTGLIDPAATIRNSTARPGDILFLTKPLGIGILTTAIKRGLLDEETVTQATEIMATLNRKASEIMVEVGVSACTDVTGYGLLGHLGEMTRGSGVSASISFPQVPVIKAARELIATDTGLAPGGSHKNLEYASGFTRFDPALGEAERLILADAQTSGGLLLACPPEKADELQKRLLDVRCWSASRVGVMGEEDSSGTITVIA